MNNLIKLSIIIPVYNGAKTISNLVKLIEQELGKFYELDLILINDCSPSDNSGEVCKNIAMEKAWVVFVDLSKNFGEHNAVMAGLNYCTGDYAVIMDDDFQNPPSEVKKLVEEILKGKDVVFSYYLNKNHGYIRNIGSKFNNLVASIILDKPIDLYLSSFKILNRFIINEIIKYDGPYPYIDGLILRTSRNYSCVEVEHKKRLNGSSGYTIKKLVSLWMNMFTNFSIIPLRMAMYLGFIVATLSFISAVFILFEKLNNPSLPVGWASLIVSVLFISSIHLLAVGMLGEYLGRLFMKVNNSPQFVIRNIIKNKEIQGFHEFN